MAAVGDGQYLASNRNYGVKEYVCSLKNDEIFCRVGVVATTAGLGAAIGAGCGAVAATPTIIGIPAGAASGAFIGGMVGLGIGLAGEMMSHAVEYRNACERLRNSQVLDDGEDGMTVFTKKLAVLNFDPDYQCGILHAPMTQPVRIEGENQLYERRALVKWVRENGTSPMTRRPIAERDIQGAPRGLAYNGKMCHAILENPELLSSFTPDEQVALRAYRKDCMKESKRFYHKETQDILKKATDIATARQSLQQLTDLVEMMDPVVNMDFSPLMVSEAFGEGQDGDDEEKVPG